MSSLSAHPNVWNSCLLLLREQGYALSLDCPDSQRQGLEECDWLARRDGCELRAGDPLTLLGLAGLHQRAATATSEPYWWSLEGPDIVAELCEQIWGESES